MLWFDATVPAAQESESRTTDKKQQLKWFPCMQSVIAERRRIAATSRILLLHQCCCRFRRRRHRRRAVDCPKRNRNVFRYMCAREGCGREIPSACPSDFKDACARQTAQRIAARSLGYWRGREVRLSRHHQLVGSGARDGRRAFSRPVADPCPCLPRHNSTRPGFVGAEMQRRRLATSCYAARAA
jgi:hypothetical protein